MESGRSDERRAAMSVPDNDLSAVKAEAGGTAADGGASIDKVRDILFGSHLREFERRFIRLEERLVKETNDLKEDVRSRLEALEAFARSEEHTSELQSLRHLVCRLLLEKKKKNQKHTHHRPQ